LDLWSLERARLDLRESLWTFSASNGEKGVFVKKMPKLKDRKKNLINAITSKYRLERKMRAVNGLKSIGNGIFPAFRVFSREILSDKMVIWPS